MPATVPEAPDASVAAPEGPVPPIAAASDESEAEAVESAPDARRTEPIEVEARIEEAARAALVVIEQPRKQGFFARIAHLLARRRRR